MKGEIELEAAIGIEPMNKGFEVLKDPVCKLFGFCLALSMQPKSA